MARRKGHRRGGNKKIPILSLLGIGLGGYTLIKSTIDTVADKRDEHLLLCLTGYSQDEKKFRFDWPIKVYGPMIAGVIGSKIAARTGMNRAISGVPVVKL